MEPAQRLRGLTRHLDTNLARNTASRKRRSGYHRNSIAAQPTPCGLLHVPPRHNIFLHFLPRDTRRLNGIFDKLSPEEHSQWLRQCINVAAILTGDYCIVNPGSLDECRIARRVLLEYAQLFPAGVIRFSMRETTLEQHFEKKSWQYRHLRPYYPDRITKDVIDALPPTRTVERSFPMGQAIAAALQSAPDDSGAFGMFLGNLSPSAVELMSTIPARLREDGEAVTWAAIRKEMIMRPAGLEIDDIAGQKLLLHLYFGLHHHHEGVAFLTSIPYLDRDLDLPASSLRYDYDAFLNFCGQLGLHQAVISLTPEMLVAARTTAAFLLLREVFDRLALACGHRQDLEKTVALALTRTRRLQRTARRSLSRRFRSKPSFRQLSEIIGTVALELETALSDAWTGPGPLRSHNPLVEASSTSGLGPRNSHSQRRVALFVPLDEERRILVEELGMEFDHEAKRYAATRDYIRFEAICPAKAGRLGAAIEVMDTLASTNFDLVVVVGIAGGFEVAGLEQGHVVIADSVVDMATRKRIRDLASGVSQVSIRPDEYPTLEAVSRYVFSGAFDEGGWREEVKQCDPHDWPSNRVPALTRGKLSCLDEVVADDAYIAELRAQYSTVVGVEMESAGVAAAARRLRLPFAVIRGVSDLADPYKADNKWRKLAMRGVAVLVRHLDFEEILDRPNGR